MNKRENAILKTDCTEGFLLSEHDIQNVRSHVEDGKVALVSGMLSTAECDSLRHCLIDWSRKNSQFPTGSSAQLSDLNFHRINDGSKPAHIDHRMHVFGFGDVETLPEPLRSPLKSASGRLQTLTNQIAQTDHSIGADGLRVMLMHLPKGGGYIAPHQHPLTPNMIVSLLVLSRPGEDFRSGGMDFKTASGWQQIGSDCGLHQGDVILAKADLPHGFAEIDAREEIAWRSVDGFWGLSCEHLSSYSEAHQLAAE